MDHQRDLANKQLLQDKSPNLLFRTDDGAKVDLVIIDPDRRRYAIEIKSAVDVSNSELGRVFQSLNAHGEIAKKICITNGVRRYTSDGVDFMPWRDMFEWLRLL